ncbi:uncharacterized protein LOC113228593 isoform X1 [Hyposmocoma kahamanoa]|uniref:uncharacterized protein LOC113228593 isoform X1 n=1 Tax=Hyposmocoma kahamanoa TaxID=1477025 RepID=UPI000E6D87FA|nr:uncharacterized protein LOC113228593 isoform X1 [Hyposmocoma kahamanoa]
MNKYTQQASHEEVRIPSSGLPTGRSGGSWCKQILLYSRRPLPIKTWGMGSWQRVLFVMPYLVSMCNIVSLSRLSNLLPRIMHRVFFPGTRYFADYTMALFNTSDFYNATSVMDFTKGSMRPSPDVVPSPAFEWQQYMTGKRINRKLYPHWSTAEFCMFPNMYSRRYKSRRMMQVVENSYMPNINYWHLMWYKFMLVVAFEQLAVLLGIIAHMLLDTCEEKVRNSLDVENLIKASRVNLEEEKKLN